MKYTLLLLSIFICAHIVYAGVHSDAGTELKKDVGSKDEASYESKSLNDINEERDSESKSQRLKIREGKIREIQDSNQLNLKITKLIYCQTIR